MKPIRIAIKILASVFGVGGFLCLAWGLFTFHPFYTGAGLFLIGLGFYTNYLINGCY